MSETVHYRGKIKLIPLKVKETYDSIAELLLNEKNYKFTDYDEKYNKDKFAVILSDEFYEEYVYINNKLYTIELKENIDLEEEIIEAKECEDGTIDYELRYYNGGAGFEECLEQALNKINK